MVARHSAAGWTMVPVDDKASIIAKMEWEHLSDEKLIARYRAETNKARAEQYINELFRRHHVKVARWCLAFTNDRESAADLAQEICAKAYKSLHSFHGQSKFSTWLFSIARNHCLNAIRTRSSLPGMDSLHAVLDTLPDLAAENPDVMMERKQLAEIACQILCEALEETERVVFTLHFAEELPLDVIGRMLNLTNASGAKAYVVSAKRKLERAIRIWKAKN
ncbi:MAG TPA: RNA polymerase sigma factor [Candidatus Angelobacter sp.]|nr:RNA polymerase sigma factor [Candidatus Angelobacter sp.]